MSTPAQTAHKPNQPHPPVRTPASTPGPGKTEVKPEPEKKERTYKRANFKPVPLDAMKADDVPEAEWGSHPLSSGAERDDAQKEVDGWVRDIHAKWKEAGEPEIRQAPRKRIRISPEHAPAVRWMLGRAADLLHVYVKFDETGHASDGREVITFTARDRRKRETKTDAKPEGSPKSPETASAKSQ